MNKITIVMLILSILLISGCTGYQSIKQNNVFVGNWRSDGAYFTFENDGTGTITYNVLIDYTTSKPFTYEYTEKSIIITSISNDGNDLNRDEYNYKLDGNILELEYTKNNKKSFLIKQ